MQSPPFPRYLVPPGSKYSPQHNVIKHPQLPFLPQCQRPSFTLIQNNRQNYSSIYLIFKFLDSNLEDKRFCTELICEVLLVNKRVQTWRRSVSLIYTSDKFSANRMQNMYLNITLREKYNTAIILLIDTVCGTTN